MALLHGLHINIESHHFFEIHLFFNASCLRQLPFYTLTKSTVSSSSFVLYGLINVVCIYE